MANEVTQNVDIKTNVDVKVHGDGDIKKITDPVQNIVTLAEEVKKELNSINLATPITEIDRLRNKVEELKNTIYDARNTGAISEEEMFGALNIAKSYNIDNKIAELKSYEEQFDNLNTSVDSFINNWNVFINRDISGQIQDFENIRSEIDSITEQVYNLKLDILNKDQIAYVNEYVDALNTITPILDEIEHKKDVLNLGNSLVKPDFNNQLYNEADAYFNKLDKDLEQSTKKAEQFKNIIKPDFDIEYSGASPQDLEWLNNVNFDNIEEDDKKVNKLKDTLIQLASSGNLSTSSIKSLLASLGVAAPEIAAITAAIGYLVLVLKQVSNTIDTILNGLKQGGKYTTDFLKNLTGLNLRIAIDGLKGFNDAIKDTINLLKNTSNEIKNLSAYGIEAQDAFFAIYQYLGSEAGNELISYTEKLSDLFNLDATNLETNMKGILATTSQLGLQSDGVIKYTKALTNLALNLSAFSGDTVDNISKQFENVINLGILNSRSSIAKALDLNDQDIAEFKKLNTQIERTNFLLNKGVIIEGTYDKYTQTVAGSLMQLRNVYNNLMSTVGLFASYLASTVTPILINILKLTNTALQALMNFLNIDTSSAGANGSQGLAGRYSEVSDAIQDVGDAAAKASKKVASFDDVITLDDGDTNTIADLLPSNNLDLNGLFNDDALDNEEITIDTIKNKLKEMLADLKEMMEGIDWQANIDKAGILGKALAELGNIVVDDKDLWSDFGITVGGALNTILSLLNSFASSFNFLGFGDSLALAWNTMLNTLDTKLAGSAIYNWFMGAVDFFIGLLSNNVISNTIKKILDIITSSISNITDDDITAIGDLVTLILNEITNSIDYITEFLSNEENKQKLIAIITEIFTAIGQELPILMLSLSRLIVSELDLLGDSIVAAIDGLFEGRENDELLIDKIVHSIINVIDAVFKNINKIGNAIKAHKEEIIQLVASLIQSIIDNSSEWGKQLEPLVTTIADILKNINWSQLFDAIYNIFKESNITELIGQLLITQAKLKWEWFKLKVRTVIDTFLSGDLPGWINGPLMSMLGGLLGNIPLMIVGGLSTIFGILKDFFNIDVVGFLKNWWDTCIIPMGNDIYKWFDEVITGITEIFKKIWNYKIGGYEFKLPDFVGGGTLFTIPKLATGGIVDGSILANIGESGREAVLPLDKNTEWMDALADRMASRLNTTTNSNGPVEIKLSDKNFYTRAEMLDFAGLVVNALNVYGIDVAVSY